MTNNQINNAVRDQNRRIDHIRISRTNMSNQASNHSNNVNTSINNILSRLQSGLNHSTRNGQIQGMFGNNREQLVGSDNFLSQADHSMLLEIQASQNRINNLNDQRT